MENDVLNFYEKTGGLTILVIKNNGDSFDYIRGSTASHRRLAYFPHWDDARQFMYPGKCYAILCKVKLNNSKASLRPLGVLAELTEPEAVTVSAQHVRDVENGDWDPTEYPRFFQICQDFERDFKDKIRAKMDAYRENVKKSILEF